MERAAIVRHQVAEKSGIGARIMPPPPPDRIRRVNQGESMPMQNRPSRKVLLVEDEALVAMVMTDTLIELGFDVVEAATAQAALDHAGAGHAQFEFAVIDLGLPDRPGEELIAELKMLRPGFPIIVASGHSEEVLRKRIKADAHVAFLSKPYDLAGLQTAIEALARG
jgi:CheY-like chemotaxis protein